jgi:hypothetical protein
LILLPDMHKKLLSHPSFSYLHFSNFFLIFFTLKNGVG